MPIYMDRHIVPGIEAKHAAEAHREDLKIQDEYGCRCMTYWVDEAHGSAFCLIDAPNEEAVKQMHDRAHGLMPFEIVQVNSNVVEAFLGRISDPEGYSEMSDDLKIFNDPAFRIILVAHTTDTNLLKHNLGKKKAMRLVAVFNEIFRKELQLYEGREVELKGQGFVASFVSVTQAVSCAAQVQKGMHIAGELMNLRMGISAGMPVEKSKELFGDTINTARNLAYIGAENQIVLAPVIKEIYKEDGRTAYDQDRFNWVDPTDDNFLQLLFDTLEKHWQTPHTEIGDLCKAMSMSKSKLYRKTTQLTGMSPNELLRDYRLTKSLSLLKTERNISQTTFDCGFSSPSYFTKCFQQRFGLQPMEFIKDLG
ncbi:MAG: DUF4242 domain-containing protein [Eudoraea sp.]|nr:DUF4242 domain-containing protein [Eudoraea sp.]